MNEHNRTRAIKVALWSDGVFELVELPHKPADEVFVLDVYAAREQPLAGVSGATVAGHVSVPVTYLPDFSTVAERVAAAANSGDVVVTMGAGDVTMLGQEILAALQVKANRSAPGRSGTAFR